MPIGLGSRPTSSYSHPSLDRATPAQALLLDLHRERYFRIRHVISFSMAHSRGYVDRIRLRADSTFVEQRLREWAAAEKFRGHATPLFPQEGCQGEKQKLGHIFSGSRSPACPRGHGLRQLAAALETTSLLVVDSAILEPESKLPGTKAQASLRTPSRQKMCPSLRKKRSLGGMIPVLSMVVPSTLAAVLLA
jgi:hypothetical protein